MHLNNLLTCRQIGPAKVSKSEHEFSEPRKLYDLQIHISRETLNHGIRNKSKNGCLPALVFIYFVKILSSFYHPHPHNRLHSFQMNSKSVHLSFDRREQVKI